MKADLTMSFLTDPKHLWLEVESTTREQAWSQSRACATPWARWNAYLNLVCLDVFLPWLNEEHNLKGKVWPHPGTVLSFSELVQGVCISVGDLRLVLVPSDTLDWGRMYIAQEWIDIPNWIANYYLATNLNCDAGWLQVIGFAAHQTVKDCGIYESEDRQYEVNISALTQDLNALWLTRQFCDLPQKTQVGTAPMPLTQAQNLMTRLGNPAVIWPRLSVPFEQWRQLVQHGGWRQQLSDRRQGVSSLGSVSQWLRTQLPEAIQDMGWQLITLPLMPEGARGNDPQPSSQILLRQLIVAGLAYELRIFPLPTKTHHWRVELHSLGLGRSIPEGMKLILLTEDLQPFENNVATASLPTEVLGLEVVMEPGEGLVWQTSPLAEDYDQEILYF